MKLFIAHDDIGHESIAKWVCERIPHVESFSNMKTIGVMDETGNPLGAVVYHEYRDHDIQMSCAADSSRWLTRNILATIFEYPFSQLQCNRVTALTPLRNKHTRQFLEKTGFKQEGIMRRGFNDDDCVIYGMLREECKWIERENHG